MPRISQDIAVPLFFKIGAGLSQRFGQILDGCGIQYERIGFLTGARFSADIARRLASTLAPGKRVCHFRVEEASEEAVLKIHGGCEECHVDLVVSVGGGSVIDVGKRLQRRFKYRNIVVPTIVSNDGLMSPISVLLGTDGKRDSVPSATPVGAVVDVDFIRTAPLRYIVAAAGDVLSNLSASCDWRRLHENGSPEPFNDLAFHLSLGSAQSLTHFHDISFDNDDFVECIIRAQIYSGIAMSLAGSSRPCSGAEHLISHAIDQLQLGDANALHGIQVGSVALFVLWLLGTNVSPAMGFARKIGLPTDWRALYPKLPSNLVSIFQAARVVRPGRKTVLDSFSDRELIDESEKFYKFCLAPPKQSLQASSSHHAYLS